MKPKDREIFVRLRLQHAKETLAEVKGIIAMGYWRTAANRMYYACYYAVSALLIKHGYSARTHSGIISLLGVHFVSKGLISKEYGQFYGKLAGLRNTSDYDAWITVDAEDVLPRIATAEEFIATIEKLTDDNQLKIEK